MDSSLGLWDFGTETGFLQSDIEIYGFVPQETRLLGVLN